MRFIQEYGCGPTFMRINHLSPGFGLGNQLCCLNLILSFSWKQRMLSSTQHYCILCILKDMQKKRSNFICPLPHPAVLMLATLLLNSSN